MRKILLVALAALLAGGISTGQAAPPKVVGVVEDAGRTNDLATAHYEMGLAELMGYQMVRITATWVPSQVEAYNDINAVCNAVTAANLRGIEVLLNITPVWGKKARAPRTASEIRTFGTLVGHYVHQLKTSPLCATSQKTLYIECLNEPNYPVFWPSHVVDGVEVTAQVVTRTLGACYDGAKKTGRELGVETLVVGPGLAASNSPVEFIKGMGRSYREMGRKRRLFDAFSYHPYEDSSKVVPDTYRHYRALATALGEAFDGSGQRGSDSPIWYTEFGVESRVLQPFSNHYVGVEPVTTGAVDEATQAAYYREMLRSAACQPKVERILFFHLRDEQKLNGGLQSGAFYHNGTPKSSMPVIRQAVMDTRTGSIASCG